jgi:hypothetical protein
LFILIGIIGFITGTYTSLQAIIQKLWLTILLLFVYTFYLFTKKLCFL